MQFSCIRYAHRTIIQAHPSVLSTSKLMGSRCQAAAQSSACQGLHRCQVRFKVRIPRLRLALILLA